MWWMALIDKAKGEANKNDQDDAAQKERAAQQQERINAQRQNTMQSVDSGGVASGNALENSAAQRQQGLGGQQSDQDRAQRRQRWKAAGSALMSTYLGGGRDNPDTGFGS